MDDLSQQQVRTQHRKSSLKFGSEPALRLPVHQNALGLKPYSKKLLSHSIYRRTPIDG